MGSGPEFARQHDVATRCRDRETLQSTAADRDIARDRLERQFHRAGGADRDVARDGLRVHLSRRLAEVEITRSRPKVLPATEPGRDDVGACCLNVDLGALRDFDHEADISAAPVGRHADPDPRLLTEGDSARRRLDVEVVGEGSPARVGDPDPVALDRSELDVPVDEPDRDFPARANRMVRRNLVLGLGVSFLVAVAAGVG